jgi:hypothetical protein
LNQILRYQFSPIFIDLSLSANNLASKVQNIALSIP